MVRKEFIFFLTTSWQFFTGKVMALGMQNFKMEEFQICEDVHDPKITFFATPRNFNPGLQLVDVNLSLPVPVGNDFLIQATFELESLIMSRQTWTKVIEINGEVCKTIDRYMGQFWYDLQRGMGMMPQSCPYPRGSYHAVNFPMNYEKLKLPPFPIGKIRIRMQFFDKYNPEIEGCGIFIMSTQ